MAVRSTMQTNLIPRVRLLIGDPAGGSQVFTDQDVQDVLDESRQDIGNMGLTPYWTYSGSSAQVLDYYREQLKLREVDGNQSIDQVQAMLLNEINNSRRRETKA